MVSTWPSHPQSGELAPSEGRLSRAAHPYFNGVDCAQVSAEMGRGVLGSERDQKLQTLVMPSVLSVR